MSKRTIGALMLILAMFPAGTVGATELRTAEKDYVAAGYVKAGNAEIHNYCMKLRESDTGGACFTVRRGERTVAVRINDDSGEAISGRIMIEDQKDVRFCAATDGRVRIPRGQRVLPVVLESGGCAGDPTGVPTGGSIRAMFRR